jgi:uncharacterized membrane protein YccC
MISMLQDNREYFLSIAAKFYPEKAAVYEDRQRVRKKALVSLANLSDAFSRMTSEPKSQQKQIEKVHQFVVLNHRLTSHVSTLFHYHQSEMTISDQVNLEPVISATKNYLTVAEAYLEKLATAEKAEQAEDALRMLYEEVNILLERRREELRAGQLETATKKKLSELKSIIDQFKFIYKIAAEIKKVTLTLELI